MKRTLAIFLALAVAAGVTACGDKSGGAGVAGVAGGGPVGSWTMDVEKFLDMGMAEAKKELAKLPEEQRKMAEQMMGGADARKMMAEKLGGMKMEVNVAADKTFTVTAQEPGETKADVMAGTWEEKDGKYVFQTKTKNGEPASGADAKTVEAKMVGGNLVLTMPEGPEMAFKRK